MVSQDPQKRRGADVFAVRVGRLVLERVRKGQETAHSAAYVRKELGLDNWFYCQRKNPVAQAARRILDFTVRRVIGRDDPRNTVKALKGGRSLERRWLARGCRKSDYV